MRVAGVFLLFGVWACAGCSASPLESHADGGDGDTGAGRGGGGGSGGNPGGAGAGTGGLLILLGAGGHAYGGGPQYVISCLDGNGAPRFPYCGQDTDCKTLVVPTCCGSDLLVGMTAGTDCTLPALECGGLGCAKFPYPVDGKGKTTEGGGEIVAYCAPGSDLSQHCESMVLSSTPCGADRCQADELCVHPPTTGQDAGASPAAFCVPAPPACRFRMECSCLYAEICGPDAICASVVGGEVTCAALAP